VCSSDLERLGVAYVNGPLVRGKNGESVLPQSKHDSMPGRWY
jgi:hypothetical protein